MEAQFIKAVDGAVEKVVRDFQIDSDRYWNERDIHWSLFRHLKNQAVFQQNHEPEIIRAEFPTRRVYEKTDGGRGARGHYDLVVLDPDSLKNPTLRAMTPWTPWGECIHLMEVVVAIEIKAWSDRWQNIGQRINFDLRKLTDPENAVKHPYFLNFVQLDFKKDQMITYYSELREKLAGVLRNKSQLKILCVPSDAGLKTQGGYWISVTD